MMKYILFVSTDGYIDSSSPTIDEALDRLSGFALSVCSIWQSDGELLFRGSKVSNSDIALLRAAVLALRPAKPKVYEKSICRTI